MSAADYYLENIQKLIAELQDNQSSQINQAASLVANSVKKNGVIHAFGTGHSHMLAEEMFYRAGGLAQVNPIFDERLMLHKSAILSTDFERTTGLAEEILSKHDVGSDDCFIIASNSGGNAVIEEMAKHLRFLKVPIIAITSLKHANDLTARTTGSKLHQFADVVIDNLGIPGDASIRVGDLYVGPTSSVLGCAIVNAITVRAIELLVASGESPAVFMSSNTEIGDKANKDLLEKLPKKIRSL